MSRGAQDWVARTDLLLQTLSELIIRNKFGAFADVDITKNVTASSATEFVSLSGKGIIFGLVAFINGVATQGNDFGRVELDGETADAPTLLECRDNSLIVPLHAIPHVPLYDEVNFNYCLAWYADMTFESSAVIKYIEAHGRTPSVKLRIGLAVI